MLKADERSAVQPLHTNRHLSTNKTPNKLTASQVCALVHGWFTYIMPPPHDCC